MPRASNRTSDDVYMWLEQESATRGTANCVTDFFTALWCLLLYRTTTT